MSKIGEQALLPSSYKNKVRGSEVVAVIRYYSNDPSVEIEVVVQDGRTKTYCAQDYNGNEYYIPYDEMFMERKIYEEGRLKTIIYTQE